MISSLTQIAGNFILCFSIKNGHWLKQWLKCFIWGTFEIHSTFIMQHQTQCINNKNFYTCSIFSGGKGFQGSWNISPFLPTYLNKHIFQNTVFLRSSFKNINQNITEHKGIKWKFICIVGINDSCQFLKHYYCLQYDGSFVITEMQQQGGCAILGEKGSA